MSAVVHSCRCALTRNGEIEWTSGACVSPFVLGSRIRKDGLYHLAIDERLSATGEERLAFASWIVDRTPPNTTITEIHSISIDSKRFVFTATDAWPVFNFECRLDSGVWYNCTSPETIKTSIGHHRLEVRAIDQASNADPTPDMHSWYRSSSSIYMVKGDSHSRSILQYYSHIYGDDDDDDSVFSDSLSSTLTSNTSTLLVDSYYATFYSGDDSSFEDTEEDSSFFDPYDDLYIQPSFSPDPFGEEEGAEDCYTFSAFYNAYEGCLYHGSQDGSQQKSQNDVSIEFSASSSESDEKDNRIITIIITVAVFLFFAVFCGVTIYARYVQLRLKHQASLLELS